ncbi:hypothetical protein LTR10_018445 [Elasticomyces elasticus]|uniref:FAD-binding domain-containing protein n=1 Tax=Exophiala sideris TaxID=1016849 RepID=A0ABR0J7Q6_9EURO|nr:hypothetical protein LTR10_018445 [Elasticomyces elasticus]KAK5029495.1 hypothetical protein LTS07_005957 [Exophiala sideris]KAK5036808.1 hypothetical protein LTR13_005188 [Exophiala sideris]KAK5058125.1 hypothetical protein LTR69_007122 [Exophiala sideris]KAK5182084.1 hypothetical protein LTR44_005685 [Eurotiomycetes sp. CCFEE 6388]
MESIPVVIVGAGPAGLTLGLLLAERGIRSLILEKELEITDDPRGVYLAGDAVRTLWHLGLRDNISEIGYQSTLRSRVRQSQYCELRCGAEVVGRQELEDGLIVDFKSGGQNRQIKCSWMVGADGKRGVVRKKFLEPTANIVQEVGLCSYSETWVAANLKIRLPTPETHPDFALWKAGFTPERVYDLFWPNDWHFSSPPGKPTACGRFGALQDRYWRHEFAEPDWDDSKDATELLWQELRPLLTRDADEKGHRFPSGKILFPTDCVEIIRCRPFTFAQKVVNKWFHRRTILIGDAAHVFPPFGGQGISCGIRDAEGLAWRLSVLLRLPFISPTAANNILTAWSLERRQGVDDSTRLTMANGDLVNGTEAWSKYCMRTVYTLLSTIPLVRSVLPPPPNMDAAGYKRTSQGFFLADYNGGGKSAQIHVQTENSACFLSDQVLSHKNTTLTLLVIGQYSTEESDTVKGLIKAADIHPSIISAESIVFYCPKRKLDTVDSISKKPSEYGTIFPVRETEVQQDDAILQGYSIRPYLDRLGKGAKYAVIRPDAIIFSVAKNAAELGHCLEGLKAKVVQ